MTSTPILAVISPATGIEDARLAEAELAPCLTPMIARLAEPYRSAIELTTRQGLTQTAAAERVGVSVSGMKSRVQRAREQLNRCSCGAARWTSTGVVVFPITSRASRARAGARATRPCL